MTWMMINKDYFHNLNRESWISKVGQIDFFVQLSLVTSFLTSTPFLYLLLILVITGLMADKHQNEVSSDYGSDDRTDFELEMSCIITLKATNKFISVIGKIRNVRICWGEISKSPQKILVDRSDQLKYSKK